LIGPLLAFAVLWAAPGAYDAVFVVSFAVAVIGLAIIGLFVEDRRQAAPIAVDTVRPRLRALLQNRRFGAVVVAGGLLGLLTASDALVYLLVQRQSSLPVTMFPLLFVGTAASYFALALPFGRVADRLGRHRLFLVGHVFVLLVYVLLLQPRLPVAAGIACVSLLGAYYAATDGVLSALASTVLPVSQLTTGLAVVSTVVALARLLAASLFGALWTWWDARGALVAFMGGLIVATLVAVLLLRVTQPWGARQES
jgi:hypothetical protein